MNSSSSKQKFSDSPIFEPKHINLSSIRTKLYILDVPLLRRHLRYISQTTLKMFSFFFFFQFILLHNGTALIQSLKISSSSHIQGDFESRAEILTTSYWLHAELGKNI
jgi:hypothetical protein